MEGNEIPICGHLVYFLAILYTYFMAIWYICWLFGIFFQLWYIVLRKIWQPCNKDPQLLSFPERHSQN
jgi:hypothetical protein